MTSIPKNNRTKLVLLLAVFIVPMVMSWILFYFRADLHFKTTNHGTLVSPAQYSQDLALPAQQAKQWQIVYVPAGCGNVKQMFLLHQLRLVLGKDAKRVMLTAVLDKQCANVDAHDFRKVVFTDAQYSHLQKDKIYLVDPIGNLFMYYSSDTDPMNILKDMQKVLEVSQIG
jgi:hypothetical protein